MQNTITHLTQNAIRSIHERKLEALPLIVQITEIGDTMTAQNQAKITECTISDGFAYNKIQFYNLSPQILTSAGKVKPVVKIVDYSFKGDYLIVRKHEIINQDIREMAGKPIFFYDYEKQMYNNPAGNNEIPVSKASHQIILNSKKKTSVKLESFNENNNIMQIEQTQAHQKTGQKLSLTSQKTTQRPSIQNIENQISKLGDLAPMKISELFPGIRGFKIKGRVTSKSEKTPFKSGKGYFFNIEIMDSEKTTISASFFNQTADKFMNKIELGKVYFFENGQVKTNKYQSKGGNSSDYQITFEDFSKIVEADEDQNIQQLALECKTITEIESMPLESRVDFMGVVGDAQKLVQITTKTNEARQKRSFTLFDQTQKGIEVTLWGNAAEKSDFKKGDFLAIRGLKISEYQGERGLTASGQTTYEKDPKKLETIPGFQDLYNFYQANKDFIELKPREASKMKMKTSYITQIEKEFDGKTDLKFQKFYEIRGYVGYINQKQNLHYDSCQDCHKKVTQQQNRQYYCQSCNKYFDKPTGRYMFQAKVIDPSASMYFSINNNQGIMILKKSADEYLSMSDIEKSNLIKRAMNQEYRFLVVGKIEEYNGQIRPRYSVASIIADDFAQESIEMVHQLEELLQIQ